MAPVPEAVADVARTVDNHTNALADIVQHRIVDEMLRTQQVVKRLAERLGKGLDDEGRSVMTNLDDRLNAHVLAARDVITTLQATGQKTDNLTPNWLPTIDAPPEPPKAAGVPGPDTGSNLKPGPRPTPEMNRPSSGREPATGEVRTNVLKDSPEIRKDDQTERARIDREHNRQQSPNVSGAGHGVR